MKLKIWLFAVLIILFASFNAPYVYGWWDNSWGVSNKILLSNTNGTHTDEPVTVNVSTVNCTNSSFKDLRIILNNTTLVPFQFIKDSETIAFRANTTGDGTNTDYSIYCQNPNTAIGWGNKTDVFIVVDDFNNGSFSHWSGTLPTTVASGL